MSAAGGLPPSVPPPRASPTVPEDFDGEGPNTGIYPATREYTRHIGWLSVAKAAGVGLFMFGAGLIGTWRSMATEARDAGAAEAKDVRRIADATQRELERHEAEEQRHHAEEVAFHEAEARSKERLELKMDAALRGLQIFNPAPSPVPDAGVPKKVGR